jgi:hypothetical protein
VAFDYQTKEIIVMFDQYINPGDDKREFWNEHSMSAHGIRPMDDHIKEARMLEEVWERWVIFCEQFTDGDNVYNKAQIIA